MWMKKAEFGLGNKTIVGSCSNALRNTNPRGRVASERVDCKPINSENANSWVYEETH